MAKRRGTNDDDKLTGTGGNDQIFGYFGNDILIGLAGNDTIFGSEGHDLLSGGLGNDNLFGGYGADVIRGGAGNDLLFGDAASDRLYGGSGSDLIYSEFGADHVHLGGGPARDTAIITSYGGVDTIFDFDQFDGDLLGVRIGDFDMERQISNFSITNDTDRDGVIEADIAKPQLIFDGTTLRLWFDADGTGPGRPQLVVKLDRATADFNDTPDGIPRLGLLDFDFYS